MLDNSNLTKCIKNHECGSDVLPDIKSFPTECKLVVLIISPRGGAVNPIKLVCEQNQFEVSDVEMKVPFIWKKLGDVWRLLR